MALEMTSGTVVYEHTPHTSWLHSDIVSRHLLTLIGVTLRI